MIALPKTRTRLGGIAGDAELVSQLATALFLEPEDLMRHPDHADTTPLVYVGSWQPESEQELNKRCFEAKRPWLRVRFEGMFVEIGPFTLPDAPGCLACAETRRYRASEFPKGWLALQKTLNQKTGFKAQSSSGLLTGAAHAVLAQIIAAELQTFHDNPADLQTHRAVLRLDLDDLHLQRHPFLSEPHCETCGRREADSRDTAEIRLRAQPKVRADSFRLRDLKSEDQSLRSHYVDEHLGMVRRLTKHPGNLYSNASAATLYPHNTDPDRGFGRALDFQSSQLSALMESLERYGGMRPNAKRTVVRGSFAELGDDALDPSTLGLHGADQYALPGFPFVPYDPKTQTAWVWGYSFSKRQPVLVPQNIAYYGLPSEAPAFSYECSNGCALGGSLEEAILYGIMEVVERDAFLIAWHARLELPEIDLQSVCNVTLRLQLERLRHQSGFELRAFNATLEHGVPTVWLMAVNPDPIPGSPSLLCAAGTHLSFERAIANAIGELAPNTGFFGEHYAQHLEHVQKMLDDPALCARLEDHQLLYAHVDARAELEFLLKRTQRVSIAQLEASTPPHPALNDLRDDLEHLMARFLKTGQDIVVVEQTSPEHAELGFHCVKVIMPGYLPMTFGHKYRRLHNLPRLLEVPQRLGYASTSLTMNDLRIVPHPFP